MKKYLVILLILFLSFNFASAQIKYESPLGFSLSFDKTWKRLPDEVLQQKMKFVKDLLEEKREIEFDACYQKIGNADMDFPYILLKNAYVAVHDDNDIKKIEEYNTDKTSIKNAIQYVAKDKLTIDYEIGKSYYDSQNKILIIIYNANISIKGNLVLMNVFYFGKNATLTFYCYSFKDEFKYDQKEFIDVIYSIKDKGMVNPMNVYLTKHTNAINYYNNGKLQSEKENRQEAINFYTKAIDCYPIEDSYFKALAYYNRGLNKRYLNNLKGAISDYSESIRLRPDYYKAYNNRGYAKLLLEDYSGAILDFDIVIKLDNFNTEYSAMALGNRGIAKLILGQDGCADLKKAIEIGNQNALNYYTKYCK